MAQKKYLDYTGLEHYNDLIEQKYAPLDSPELVGVPTAPTAAEGTKTTQIATTEFVQEAIKTITSAYVYRGTVLNVAALPIVADEAIGNVYNITEKSETTADFVEGAGHVVDAGANVAVAEIKTGVDYEEITPVGDENPKELGWYEYDGADYILTADETVQAKTYYEQVDVLENKWDILGGWFDVTELEAEIAKRLEFGQTMPEGTVEEPLANGRTFLYLGETSYKYNPVLGVTASTNPKALGYYEENSSVYSLTNDEEPVQVYRAWSDGATPTATIYYTLTDTPTTADTLYVDNAGTIEASSDTITSVGADDIEVNGVTYTKSAEDNVYQDEKTYYTQAEEYVKGVVYVWDSTAQEWVAQTAGDTYVPITSAEIDALFE